MTLTNQKILLFILFTKKYWWAFLIGILIFLTIVFRILTSTGEVSISPSGLPDPEITNPNQPLPASLQVGVVISWPNLPDILPVYQALVPPQSNLNLAQNMAVRLNLVQIGSHNNVWINEDRGVSLTHSSITNVITYLTEMANIDETTVLREAEFSPTMTESAALAFFTETLGPHNLVVVSDSFRILGHEGDANEPEEELTAILSFTESLDGYPLFYNDSIFHIATIHVNRNHQVIKAELQALPPTFEKISDQPILHQELVVEQIKTGKAEVVSMTFSQFVPGARLDSRSLTSLRIDSIELEYRYSSTTNIVYPYFKLSGVGMMGGENPIRVVVITPAIMI